MDDDPLRRHHNRQEAARNLTQLRDRFLGMLSAIGGGGRATWLTAIALVLVWAASGFYRVQADEQGIELLFGAYVRTTEPGLNYWLPSPLGRVLRPKVTLTNQVAIGFRADNSTMERVRDVPTESQMLSGDQNILDIHFVVQWRIRDAADYLFNVRDPDATIKTVAESVLREVVGSSTLTAVITDQRDALAQRTGALIQSTLDAYGAGITILDVRIQKADPPGEVIDAFNDVQRAKQDAERLANEADAYRNRIVPVARGDAAQMVQRAQAAKERMVLEAEGEAARFTSFYQTYDENPRLTALRLYLETMEDIFARANMVIVDPKTGGIVPYLRLPSGARDAPAGIEPQRAPEAAPQTGEQP